MEGESVFAGVDRDGLEAQLRCRAENANRDFTAIGNEQFAHKNPEKAAVFLRPTRPAYCGKPPIKSKGRDDHHGDTEARRRVRLTCRFCWRSGMIYVARVFNPCEGCKSPNQIQLHI